MCGVWGPDLCDGCRERTKLVYTMYSRKDEEEVWKNLQKLHVKFAILEESWCVRRAKYVAIEHLFVLSSTFERYFISLDR